MTLTLAYVFDNEFLKDPKIVVMTDSRQSKVDEHGEVVTFRDDAFKIVPIDKSLVIGKAGLTSFSMGEETFNTNEIVKSFFKQNQRTIFNLTGEEILKGLIKTWNAILTDEIKQTYNLMESNFSLLLCKWEEDKPGHVIPKLYSYNSIEEEVKVVIGRGGMVIGETEAQDIIEPYFNFESINEMSLDESIAHFKKGYDEVMEKVDTVGGYVNVYVLGPNRFQSHWRHRRIINNNM